MSEHQDDGSKNAKVSLFADNHSADSGHDNDIGGYAISANSLSSMALRRARLAERYRSLKGDGD